MNASEYESNCTIISRMFDLASSRVLSVTKELEFQFVYYGRNITDNETLADMVKKSLHELGELEVEILETNEHNKILEPGHSCKCKVTKSDGSLVTEPMIIANLLQNLNYTIMYDVCRGFLIRHANNRLAISVVNGEPYILEFELNEEAADEMLKYINPAFEAIKNSIHKHVSELELMLEVVKGEESSKKVKMFVHLCFA